MPTDTQQIIEHAEKLGDLLKDHPAVARYKSAQKAVAEDPEAGRLLTEFNRQLDQLGRQEQAGMPVTDAQRQKLEVMQSQIVSHIKVKAMQLAQVEFMDLLRKVSETYQRKLADQPGGLGGGPAGAGGGTRIVQ
jgi:cell fate (sporulation/competence/biofilm development) regulator YlbF (YheA/YmcA/DUF963 family)